MTKGFNRVLDTGFFRALAMSPPDVELLPNAWNQVYMIEGDPTGRRSLPRGAPVNSIRTCVSLFKQNVYLIAQCFASGYTFELLSGTLRTWLKCVGFCLILAGTTQEPCANTRLSPTLPSPGMITHDPLEHLRNLDKTSPQFSGQLSDFLRGNVYRDVFPSLNRQDVAWLVEYLDDVRFHQTILPRKPLNGEPGPH